MRARFFIVIVLNNLFSLYVKCDETREQHKSHPVRHWGYRNEDRSLLPKNWHKDHPKCYGEKQSPINIESPLTAYDRRLKSIKIKTESGLNNEKQIWTMKNNGHSVVLNPENEGFSFNLVSDNATYKLLQMHFHWRGSEHFIDGHRYAAELHLVHQNQDDENKFAVLGFLFKSSNDDNKNLNPITNALSQVIKYNSKYELAFNLAELLPYDIENYFRYSGSLTTPGCDEKVEWLVIDRPILTVSEDQLLSFQDLEDQHGFPILTNSRPIQELNDRLIKRSFTLSTSRNLYAASSRGAFFNSSNSLMKSSIFINEFIFCLLLIKFSMYY